MVKRLSERAENERPRAGCWLLVVPIVAIPLVFTLYAYMLFHGFQGRAAEGDQVRLTIDTCPQAQEFILDRVAAMGLPNQNVKQTPTQLGIDLTLPADPDVAVAIPSTLIGAARFEVFDRDAGEGEAPLFASQDFSYAGVRLTMTASPATFIVLNADAARRLQKHMEANPYKGLRYVLDGEVIGGTDNVPSIGDGQIEIIPKNVSNDKELMEVAAARGITINSGPLPCAATVTANEVLQRAPAPVAD